MRTLFHLLALGLMLGEQRFELGSRGFTLGWPGFLDTNLLALAIQNALGVYTNASPQRKPIHVLVEYRLLFPMGECIGHVVLALLR